MAGDASIFTADPLRLRAWLRRGLLIPLLLMLPFASCAFAQTATVGAADGVAHGVRLTDRIAVLRMPAGAWPADEVLSGRRDAQFVPLADASRGSALACDDSRVCWVRLRLARSADAPEAWWLRLRAVRPGSVALYAAEDIAGDAVPQQGREFPLNWRFVGTDLFFSLALGTAPATYYLRLENTPGVDGFGLLQERGFERQQRQLGTYLNISMGVAFALMVLNLVFWRWLRDRLFLHFALLMLTAVLLHAWQIVPSTWEPERLGSLDLRAALQSLMQAATIMFVSHLFELRRHLPLAARAAIGFALLNIGIGIVAAAGHYARIEAGVMVLDVAGMAASVAAAGWLLLVRRQWQFAWPAVLTLFLAATSGLGRLRWLGVLEIGTDEGLGATWATVRLIYMLLLAVIVADRTRQAEMQLQQTRRRSLEDAQRAERLLEDKVHQRTLELNLSNAQLASEIERRRDAEADLATALASERKALVQQRQFVSLVSHEFRTPLAVIDATAQSIGLPGVQLQPRLAKIRRAVQRLGLLVENCLADDRLHTSNAPMRRETLDLRALAEGLLAHFGPIERTRIRLHLPPDPLPVHGDRALLDIALHNLAQNAIKYSPPDSEVDIRLHIAHGNACIDVEDRGGGIAPEEQARVFERFFRGSSSAGQASGSGLGLFLGTDIARAHGGSLALVCSDARGSLFRLSLPLGMGMEPALPQQAAGVR